MEQPGYPLLKEVFIGAAAPFRGLDLLFGNLRQLGPLSVVPALITAAAILLGFALGTWGALHIELSGYAPAWMPQFLVAATDWLVRVVLILLLLIVCYLIFTPVGLALATPFNDFLSARVERILLKADYVEYPGLTIWQGLLHTCQHLAVTLVIGIPLAVLAFVPFIGVLFVVPEAIFASLVLSLEFLDVPLSKRLDRYRQKWAFVRRYPGAGLGFGFVTLCFLAVPIVNLFLMPLSIIGGTWLYLKLDGGLDA